MTNQKALEFLHKDARANMPLLYLAERNDAEILQAEREGRVVGVLAYSRQGAELGNRVHVRAVDSDACRELLERVKEPGLRCTVQAEYADVVKEVLGTDGLFKQEMVAQGVSDFEPAQRTRACRSLRDEDLAIVDKLFQQHPDYTRRMAIIRSTKDKPAVLSFDDDGLASFVNVNMDLGGAYRLSNVFTHPKKTKRRHSASTIHGMAQYLFEELGASEAWAYVAEVNVPAINAFRKVGFVPRGRYFESPVAQWMLTHS